MATRAEVEAAALAIMNAEGWAYSGACIMSDENPRPKRWVALARLAINAAAAVKRKNRKKRKSTAAP